MPKDQTWEKRLRRSLKDEYGFGLRLDAKGEKTKFGLRATGDSSGTFVILPFKFVPSNAQAIRATVCHLLETMREQNVTLREAHRRCLPDGVVGEQKTQALVRGVEYVEWKAITEAFLNSRNDNRSTTRRDTAAKVQKILQTLNTKPAPRDGPSLMKAYAAQHFDRCPPGGVGRKRHLGDVSAFLRFAVLKWGASAVWLPLDGSERDALVDSSDVATEQLTVAIKPEQLAALLDALDIAERYELRLAVALVGLFGLRPAELAVLKIEGGNLWVGSGVKRNLRTKKIKKPDRLVIGLDIAGRKGEAASLLKLYSSGLIKLPLPLRNRISQCLGPNGQVMDSLKPVGDEFRQQLDRFPFWRALRVENPALTPYSLRHGYAWRAHMCGERPMATRTVAALMGHDTKTHTKHYGAWIDEEGIRGDINRWMGSAEINGST